MLTALVDFSMHKPLQAIVMRTAKDNPRSCFNTLNGGFIEALYFSPLHTASTCATLRFASFMLLHACGSLIYSTSP